MPPDRRTADTASVSTGTRVEIVHRLLEPSERAPGLPSDTAAVPYEVRVRGMLIRDGRPGEQVEVETAAGRVLAGRLETVEPGDWHSFGRPVGALSVAIAAIDELRRELG
jgi:hypothetical protein